jgi:hypothetical protein
MVQIFKQIPQVVKASKILINQKETMKAEGHPFVITKNNQILISSNINDMKDSLMFDTGFSGDILRFTDKKITKCDTCIEVINTVPSGSNKTFVKFFKINVDNNIFEWTNHFALELFNKPIECSEQLHPLLGVGAFNKDYIISLNFDSNMLYIDSTIDTSVLSNYVEVKSLFNQVPYIYITIDGKEYLFLFDTGCGYAFVMPQKDYDTKPDDILYEGVVHKDLAGLHYGEFAIRSTNSIFLSEKIKSESEYINFLPTVNMNITGIPFIKKYNWIINFRDKKLYVQQRHDHTNIQNDDKPPALYTTMIVEDKLVIVQRNKTSNPSYKLNDVIFSVNGEIITEENRCYYMELLNATADWSELNVECRNNICH